MYLCICMLCVSVLHVCEIYYRNSALRLLRYSCNLVLFVGKQANISKYRNCHIELARLLQNFGLCRR